MVLKEKGRGVEKENNLHLPSTEVSWILEMLSGDNTHFSKLRRNPSKCVKYKIKNNSSAVRNPEVKQRYIIAMNDDEFRWKLASDSVHQSTKWTLRLIFTWIHHHSWQWYKTACNQMWIPEASVNFSIEENPKNVFVIRCLGSKWNQLRNRNVLFSWTWNLFPLLVKCGRGVGQMHPWTPPS